MNQEGCSGCQKWNTSCNCGRFRISGDVIERGNQLKKVGNVVKVIPSTLRLNGYYNVNNLISSQKRKTVMCSKCEKEFIIEFGSMFTSVMTNSLRSNRVLSEPPRPKEELLAYPFIALVNNDFDIINGISNSKSEFNQDNVYAHSSLDEDGDFDLMFSRKAQSNSDSIGDFLKPDKYVEAFNISIASPVY